MPGVTRARGRIERLRRGAQNLSRAFGGFQGTGVDASYSRVGALHEVEESLTARQKLRKAVRRFFPVRIDLGDERGFAARGGDATQSRRASEQDDAVLAPGSDWRDGSAVGVGQRDRRTACDRDALQFAAGGKRQR